MRPHLLKFFFLFATVIFHVAVIVLPQNSIKPSFVEIKDASYCKIGLDKKIKSQQEFVEENAKSAS